MEALKVCDLEFKYSLNEKKALDKASFCVERGDFVAVCGATGSGKSTLLRLLKRELSPLGEASGEIRVFGKELSELSQKESASKIGYVAQRPEQQIVTDRVWHELAFGLESLSAPSDVIRRRVAETACYFGIEEWFDKSVSELSGGQKQLLSLASVMVTQPEILLLDEPTAQLDPIAATEFISTLKRLNRELSLTILIVEHRLEEVIPASDKLLALDGGKVVACGETREALKALRDRPAMLEGMPVATRLFFSLGGRGACPLDVREGRDFLERSFDTKIRSVPDSVYIHSEKTALDFREVFFRYTRETPDVLRGLSFSVYENEIFCILGGNGSGKSTSLACAAALLKPYSGAIKVFGKRLAEYKNQTLYNGCLSLLPQDVQTLFLCNTVREELAKVNQNISELPFDLSPFLESHPYDLSEGQQQLVALAKALASKPRLLLLDEPTKGLDAHTKEGFIRVIKDLKMRGTTVVCVTHDIEFSALCADRCALFFRGEIVSSDTPRRFFSENLHYTTSANRMTRGYFDYITTLDETERVCRANERRD